MRTACYFGGNTLRRIAQPQKTRQKAEQSDALPYCISNYFPACLGFAAVGLRLFSMQVVRYDFYQEKALSLQTKDDVIEPKRGTIYDRNMKVLAESAATETVNINPSGLKEWVATQNKKIQSANEKNETQTPLLSLESVQEEVAEILSSNCAIRSIIPFWKRCKREKKSIEIQGGVEKDIVNKINEDMKAAKIDTGSGNSIYTEPDTQALLPVQLVTLHPQVIRCSLNNSGA